MGYASTALWACRVSSFSFGPFDRYLYGRPSPGRRFRGKVRSGHTKRSSRFDREQNHGGHRRGSEGCIDGKTPNRYRLAYSGSSCFLRAGLVPRFSAETCIPGCSGISPTSSAKRLEGCSRSPADAYYHLGPFLCFQAVLDYAQMEDALLSKTKSSGKHLKSSRRPDVGIWWMPLRMSHRRFLSEKNPLCA